MRKMIIVAACSLIGCAGMGGGWNKADASSQDFYQDRGQCNAQAYSVVAPPQQQQFVFISCMQGKGWQWQQNQ